jgi:hypothetical protein
MKSFSWRSWQALKDRARPARAAIYFFISGSSAILVPVFESNPFVAARQGAFAKYIFNFKKQALSLRRDIFRTQTGIKKSS